MLAPVYGHIKRLSEPEGFYRVHGSNNTLKSLEEYISMYLGWFEHSCKVLSGYLEKSGILVEPEIWPRDSWFHKIHLSIEEIALHVPFADSFILVDDNHWRTGDLVAGRRCIPFIEHEGQYWGPPANDFDAIRQLERLHKEGAGFIIFAWPAFWWLDHYPAMYASLKSNHTCVLHNERLVGFKLQNP